MLPPAGEARGNIIPALLAMSHLVDSAMANSNEVTVATRVPDSSINTYTKRRGRRYLLENNAV